VRGARSSSYDVSCRTTAALCCGSRGASPAQAAGLRAPDGQQDAARSPHAEQQANKSNPSQPPHAYRAAAEPPPSCRHRGPQGPPQHWHRAWPRRRYRAGATPFLLFRPWACDIAVAAVCLPSFVGGELGSLYIPVGLIDRAAPRTCPRSSTSDHMFWLTHWITWVSVVMGWCKPKTLK
jgi:hypothetical protein